MSFTAFKLGPQSGPVSDVAGSWVVSTFPMSRTHNTRPWKFRKGCDSDRSQWPFTSRVPAWFRRMINRERRAKATQALREGAEPIPEKRDAGWRYW